MIFGRFIRMGWRIGVVVFGLLAIYLLVTFFQVWSASRDDSQDPADAIVVLGAAQYNGTPSPVLERRLDHAIELFEDGLAPRIVVTGGKQEGDQFTEAAAGFRYLREHGIAEGAILREEQGANTWAQLAASRRFLEDLGAETVILVSDDYHALRLSRIADEVGMDSHVSPVNSGLSFGGEMKAMVRETFAVATGRVIGFRRLANLR